MREKLRFLGLDVHAETIAVAVAEPEGEVRSLGTIPNRAESPLRLRLHCQRASQRSVTAPLDLLRYCRWDGRSGRVTTPDNHRDDFQVAPIPKSSWQARDTAAS
jgi:hypothetical protein